MSFSIGDKVCITKDLWGDVCQGVGYEEHVYATKNTIGTIVRVIFPDSSYEMKIEEMGSCSDELKREIYTHIGDLIGVSIDEMIKIE
jgi:hypothetical protein